eukprot:542440-Lingulodinium_polyedra.AAC.1
MFPVPQTKRKRARNIDPAIKAAVSREAAAGRLGKSGRVVAANLHRFAHAKRVLSERHANTWLPDSLRQR